MSGHTPGPWEVWDGPEYVGGGADLCIGAGEDWLANMDHRNCVNREAHLCGGDIPPCKSEPNTSICSTSGCRCTDECQVENHITEEQRANAHLIAAAPELYDEARKHVLRCPCGLPKPYGVSELMLLAKDHPEELCLSCVGMLRAIAKAEGK